MPARTRARSTPSASAKNHLPEPPHFRELLGPSFILLGLALGSGELILWPYLASQYGLGIMWGGLLGITLQFFLNTEVMRYALARGESVFVGYRKLSFFWPIWFLASTFIPWSLPGFSSAAAQIFSHLLPAISQTQFAVALLLLTGVMLTFGKTLYKTMELYQKTMIFVGLPIVIALALFLTTGTDWQELTRGLVGQGNGWWFFPPGIAIASFLGAFAYSGAGGNLNLAQSYYIKEKGFGMGRHMPKITSLLQPGKKVVSIEGQLFADTAANQRKWQTWWRLVNTEHFLIFWAMGFATIVLLAVLSKSLTHGIASSGGIGFLYVQSEIIATRTFATMGPIFLIIAGSMLFSTQVGVLESSSRILSENLLLLFHKPGRKFPMSLMFYLALWAQIILGIGFLFSGLQEPRLLLTLGAVLNGAAMMVAFPLTWWLNRRALPPENRAGMFRTAVIFIGLAFFAFFFALLLRDMI